MRRTAIGLAAIQLAATALASACLAQTPPANFPNRSIRIVLGFPSGVSDGHRRAHVCRQDFQPLWPIRRRGKPARCRRHTRREGRGSCGAGRLLAAVRQLAARDRSSGLQEPRLRHTHRFRRYRTRCRIAIGGNRLAEDRRQVAQGVHCRRQDDTRSLRLCDGGRGQSDPSGWRLLFQSSRHQAHRASLSRYRRDHS